MKNINHLLPGFEFPETVIQVSEEEQSQDIKQAESILDALKQDEQVMQKKQIARSKSRKLEKDLDINGKI